MGLPWNAPVVVNFYTYNTVCRNFSLTQMFDGMLKHEAFGTNNQNQPALANGHEARRRNAAGDPSNDPYRLIEANVDPTYMGLRATVRQEVFDADERISAAADPGHVFVANNYVQGNRCGQAWAFFTTVGAYQKIELTMNIGGTSKCF
jgi:hypothetical protein